MRESAFPDAVRWNSLIMLWLVLALLLVCSGATSASETALFGLSRQSLHEFQRSTGRLHRRAHSLMQRPHHVLMTVLMANTAVNVAIFAVSFLAFGDFDEASVMQVAAASVATPLAVILFGEMLPKAVALSNPSRLAPAAAILVGTLQFVLRPIVWLLAHLLVEPITRLLAPHPSPRGDVTTEELRLLVEHSARDGVIGSTENEMLQAVVAMPDVSVREVLTPRVDIRSVRIDEDRETVLNTVRAARRRRLPVCGRDWDDIRGVLHARDLHLNPDTPWVKLIRRADFVPEQVRLMHLLNHFRKESIHLAIVVDEYGGTVGLVTTEDIVEWIVGELPDAETPRPEALAEQIDENTYRCSGDLSARDWADRFGAGAIDRHIGTVAGLILAKLGRLPRVGDEIRIRNLTLTVETMKGRRIERVLLRRHADAPGGGRKTS